MTRQSDGFTLVEVCLAIAVMAVGVLSMCGLYTLGYRENRQSVEDVASVAYADAYLSPLVQGLSATNMTWSKWCEIGENASSEMRAQGVAASVTMHSQEGGVCVQILFRNDSKPASGGRKNPIKSE